MAKDSRHLDQWSHNRRLITLIPSTHPDWIVTVTFYTALHAVDALFAKDGITVTSHSERNHILTHTSRYSEINKKYYVLYMLSRTVRYLANPATWIPEKQIEPRVFGECLYPIEKSVFKLLKNETPRAKLTVRTGTTENVGPH